MQGTLTNAAVEQGIPPSFHGDQTFYMLGVFGLLTVVFLALNWLWRILWCLFEDRRALCAPVTLYRMIIALLLMKALLRAIPSAILLMRWPEMSLESRLFVAQAERFLDGAALIPFGIAWLIDYTTGGVLQYQLKRLPPPPTDIWPRLDALKRPAMIAAGSIAIAFAVVFLQ
jgi:hypothetical protein